MLRLFAFILPIALLDGISPPRIGAMVVLLGARRPWTDACCFILGTFLSYLLLGLAVTLGADKVLGFLTTRPQPVVYGAGIGIGALLVLVGTRNLRAQQPARRLEQPKPKSPGEVLVLSLVLTVVSAPFALPYLAAIDLILQSDVGNPGILVALAVYCTVFVAPLSVLVALRSFLGLHSAVRLDRINRVVSTLMPRLVAVLLLTLGLLMTVEGVAFFFGRPLFPTVNGWRTGLLLGSPRFWLPRP